jgi:geranylgeranyl pyrophosphate synthase
MPFDGARQRFGEVLEARLAAAVAGEGVLAEAMTYHVGAGGKRLRALLPPWIAASLGASASAVDEAIELGVGLELIHNGTLVHDDVQDGDTTRRGQPAVWVRWGMPQAINVGTTMMCLGLERILRTSVGAEFASATNRAILDVVAGQAAEFVLQTAPRPSVLAWEAMASGKTGALFRTCYAAGARAARLSGEEVAALAAFGAALGVFFQLQDDLLDLVGDKGREVPATDLAEGKISYPVAWAAEHAPADQAERLLAIVHAPRADTSPAMVAEGLALLHATGAIDAAVSSLRSRAEALASEPWAALTLGLIARVLEPVHIAIG